MVDIINLFKIFNNTLNKIDNTYYSCRQNTDYLKQPTLTRMKYLKEKLENCKANKKRERK